MKKRFLSLILGTVLAAGIFTGCNSSASETTPQEGAEEESTQGESGQEDETEAVTLTVGVSPTPHGEILMAAKDLLAAEGIELKMIEFTDYIQPNLALEDGSLDANYFQHGPYLDSFNAENGTKLVSIGNIHYEPMGIFAGKKDDLAAVAEGDKIAVPNDPTNEARALLLLETNGIIKLNPEAGITATKADIVENPKNVEIVEMEAAQVPRSIGDVEFAVINGNYALQAGLNTSTDSLAKEEKDSLAATTYANIVVAREGDDRPELKKLIEALKSQDVKDYIANTYEGAVESID